MTRTQFDSVVGSWHLAREGKGLMSTVLRSFDRKRGRQAKKAPKDCGLGTQRTVRARWTMRKVVTEYRVVGNEWHASRSNGNCAAHAFDTRDVLMSTTTMRKNWFDLDNIRPDHRMC